MFKKTALFIVLLFTMAAILPAQDFEKVEIETIKITDNIFMLKGAGGNMGLCVGDDGAFLIDDQFAPLHEKIKTAVAAVTDQEIRFLLNTHFHADHTGGNELVGETSTVIVAHENVRKRMSVDQAVPFFNIELPPAPEVALPVITFTSDLKFHINNDEVEIFHVSDAHTDGDAVVYFTKANVLHAGDIFFQGSYPFVDQHNGGTVKGVLLAINTILEKINDSTIIIPGHGELSNTAEFAAQHQMLKDLYGSIKVMVNKGMTLDEINAAPLTDAYDEIYKGMIPPEAFVKFIYDEVSK